MFMTSIKDLILRGHLSLPDAVYQGAMVRLQPVAVTALVPSLGFVLMPKRYRLFFPGVWCRRRGTSVQSCM